MEPVSEEVKKNVYQMFGRTEEMVEDDVNIIKNWMKSQRHLPEIMEDVKIRNFLNLNKYSIEKTKAKIDMYYTIRSVIPELFEESNPKCERMKSVFDNSYCFYFPKTVNGMHRVHLLKQKRPNCLQPREICAMWFAMFEVRLYEDFMVDDIIITDFDNFSLSDMTMVGPTIVSKFFSVYKKVYSLRLKKVIDVNCPSFMNILTSVLKTVMSPKLFSRIEFHTDTAVLKTLFSQEDLPKDYGGDGPTLEELNEMMKKKFEQYQSRFDKLDTLRVDESLRMEKLDNDEILGFYGNFKKLNVD